MNSIILNTFPFKTSHILNQESSEKVYTTIAVLPQFLAKYLHNFLSIIMIPLEFEIQQFFPLNMPRILKIGQMIYTKKEREMIGIEIDR